MHIPRNGLTVISHSQFKSCSNTYRCNFCRHKHSFAAAALNAHFAVAFCFRICRGKNRRQLCGVKTAFAFILQQQILIWRGGWVGGGGAGGIVQLAERRTEKPGAILTRRFNVMHGAAARHGIFFFQSLNFQYRRSYSVVTRHSPGVQSHVLNICAHVQNQSQTLAA